MRDAFAAARNIAGALRAVAHDARSGRLEAGVGKSVEKIQMICVAFLESIRECVNEAFQRVASAEQLTKRVETAKRALRTLGVPMDVYEEKARKERQCVADAEEASIRSAAAYPEDLSLVVERLRREEERFEFHRSIYSDAHRVVGTLGKYSEENFSYGSTPFSSFLSAWRCPQVAEILNALPRNENNRAAVFGSSSGWLVYYLAYGFRFHSLGWEILPSLVDAAKSVATWRPELPRITFTAGDMLDAPLDETFALVALTSQCWDKDLTKAVHLKLSASLRPHALVLDYSSQLSDNHPQSFKCVAFKNVPVSWHPQQKLYWMQRMK